MSYDWFSLLNMWSWDYCVLSKETNQNSIDSIANETEIMEIINKSATLTIKVNSFLKDLNTCFKWSLRKQDILTQCKNNINNHVYQNIHLGGYQRKPKDNIWKSTTRNIQALHVIIALLLADSCCLSFIGFPCVFDLVPPKWMFFDTWLLMCFLHCVCMSCLGKDYFEHVFWSFKMNLFL